MKTHSPLVLGDPVEVVPADDERARHLGRHHDALENAPADRDVAGEGALLVHVRAHLQLVVRCDMRMVGKGKVVQQLPPRRNTTTREGPNPSVDTDNSLSTDLGLLGRLEAQADLLRPPKAL